MSKLPKIAGLVVLTRVTESRTANVPPHISPLAIRADRITEVRPLNVAAFCPEANACVTFGDTAVWVAETLEQVVEKVNALRVAL